MSSIQLDLCNLLNDAAGIIRRQAALLAMHGIDTEDGKLESDEFDILAEIREAVGEDSGNEENPEHEGRAEKRENHHHLPALFHKRGLLQKRCEKRADAQGRAGAFHRGQ